MRDSASLSSFVDQSYLTPLRKSQNQDGGWGFTPGGESRIESTAWALLALQEFGSQAVMDGTVERGLRFLTRTQGDDGSWAAAPGQREGCWVTSLACWALLGHRECATSLRTGLLWLNNDRPRDSGFWWRLARRLLDHGRINSQSASFSGWSWTPHTASWVEPTSYALIVQQLQTTAPVGDWRKRRELAEAMLYDRMCPQGGWNCGNPMIYGVAGQPQVGPTVWALLALRDHSDRPENRRSLDWLESNCETVRSPESLALSHIGLKAYGRRKAISIEGLNQFEESTTLPRSVQAVSWMALAFSETGRWLNIMPNRVDDW